MRYLFVGILNTFTHWLVFFVFYFLLTSNQIICNGSAFFCSRSEFFINSKWTFKKEATGWRYFLYAGFMGGIATSIGAISNIVNLNPVFTLMLFSVTGLAVGFVYSRFFVFGEQTP
ncbi:GtrA family protein [Pseudomonas sp. GL-B-19]|uniref:GtrA family protein n=1 Tax=Pseudomonas sp. GL-B-19 TaxID=2832393 RepID=UPI001CBBB08A